MSTVENKLYCRLCAGKKKENELVKVRDNLILAVKLKKVSVDVYSNYLPTTACQDCLLTLDRTVEFLDLVDKSQEFLTKLFCPSPIQYNQNNANFVAKTEKPLSTVKVEISINPVDLEFNSEADTAAIFDADIVDKSPKRKSWADYFACAKCEYTANQLADLRSHTREKHSECNSFRCKECRQKYKKLNMFMSHILKHSPYLKLSCETCLSSFTNDEALSIHRQSMHPCPNNYCKHCYESFETSDLLNDHKDLYLRKKVPSNKPSYHIECNVCHKTIANKYRLAHHIKTMHSERERNVACPLCDKKFYDKETMIGHQNIIHTNKKPFVCEICGDSFKRHSTLKAHVNVHYGYKPFECEACGKKFRLATQLKSHSLIHTDSKPYICDVCNKAFRFKSILSQHKLLHTGEKPYSCSECGRTFTTWPNYNKHMKRKHGINCAKKKVRANDIRELPETDDNNYFFNN